jgi:ABC-2 type transport system permease protein
VSALLRVEFRRILARRIVRFAGALTLFGILLAGLVLFLRSHREDPAGIAALRAQVETQYQNELAACSRGEFGISPSDVPPGLALEQFCRQIVQPPPLPDPAFHLTQYRVVAENMSAIFIFILVALGASLAGAEWHAGVVTTQLTWEPRRSRLLGAKTVATIVFAFVAFLAAEVVLGLVLAPSAIFRGTTSGADGVWLRGVAGMLLRAGAVAAMAAGIGHAIASLARNTAVAVGAVLGYAAILDPLLRALRPTWEPWLLIGNAIRLITANPLAFEGRSRSTMGAALLIATYTAAFVVASLMVFRRRDVT